MFQKAVLMEETLDFAGAGVALLEGNGQGEVCARRVARSTSRQAADPKKRRCIERNKPQRGRLRIRGSAAPNGLSELFTQAPSASAPDPLLQGCLDCSGL